MEKLSRLEQDAALGRILIRHIDRLSDPADCDPLEKIVKDLLEAVEEELQNQRWGR